MSDGRNMPSARHDGCGQDGIISIGSLWIDYHGTVAQRKTNALKWAAETAMGCTLSMSGEKVNQLVERVRLKLEGQDFFQQLDGPTRWIVINQAAFNCSDEQAIHMSELVKAESNYVVSNRRLEFIRWLLDRFPSDTAAGKFVLTASNADFPTVRRFAETFGREGMSPVSADLMHVYKPDDAFWKRLFEVTGVPPEKTLFVANSFRNDGVAARHGVNVVIILPHSVTMTGSQVLSRIGEVSGKVFVVRSLREARATIARNFIAIR